MNEYIFEVSRRENGVLKHLRSGYVRASSKVDAMRVARAKVAQAHVIVNVYPAFYTNAKKV